MCYDGVGSKGCSVGHAREQTRDNQRWSVLGRRILEGLFASAVWLIVSMDRSVAYQAEVVAPLGTSLAFETSRLAVKWSGKLILSR